MTSHVQSSPGTTVSAPASLLRSHDFRLLFVAAAISQLGTQVSFVAIPLVAVITLNATVLEVGVLGVLTTLAFLLIGLPAGAWIDRARRRRVMIAADLARALLLLSVPAAWAFGILTFSQLALVVLGVGVGTVFFDISSQSYLPHVVGREQLIRANASLVSLNAGANIGGSSIAGALLQLVAAPVAIALDAASYLWSAICLSRIRRPDERPVGLKRLSLRHDVVEGLRFVLGHPVLRAIAFSGALTNLSVMVAVTIFPVLLVRELGLSPALLGLLFAIGGAGVFLGALSARTITARLGHGRTLWLAGLLVAPFGFALPLIDGGLRFWIAASAWFVVTFKIGIDNVIQVTFRQRVTPDRLLGRMNATIRVLMTGALTVGAAVAGLIGEYVSVRGALWAAAAGISLVWLPIFVSPLRGMKELPDDVT